MALNSSVQLDELDYQILDLLIKDCRTPYLEIARICHVSGGTIHVRMKKMEDLGIIRGSRILLDLGKLGYDVYCFLGIYINKASSANSVIDELKKIPSVVEVHLVTGNYSMFAKIVAKNITDLHKILIENVNTIDGIQKVETFISLSDPIDRNITI